MDFRHVAKLVEDFGPSNLFTHLGSSLLRKDLSNMRLLQIPNIQIIYNKFGIANLPIL